MNRMIICTFVLTTLAATFLGSEVSAVHAEWKVWTLTETRRVLREEPAGSNCSVKIAAARNEWESFQVLLRSDGPLKIVGVEVGDLLGPDGTVIHKTDVRVFRQHQFHLKIPTDRNDTFKPGWYPDALIPVRHPVTRKPLSGGRFQALPFELPANETHGFWVDLHVPASAPSGKYRGTCRVATDDGKMAKIPLVLTVWDFVLPRVSTFKTAFGSPARRMRGYYQRQAKKDKEKEPVDWDNVDWDNVDWDNVDWDNVEQQCAELLSRHRINATPPAGLLTPIKQEDGTFRIPDEQIRELGTFVDRFHVNALKTSFPQNIVKDLQRDRKNLLAWLASFDRAAAQLGRAEIVFYMYLVDEPGDEEAYHYVQKWGRAIREANSVVKVLVVEQTWPQKERWGDLHGAVDIWCPLFPLFKPQNASKRRGKGETIWTYTALCQLEKTPWWHTDYPLLNYRVPTWIAWRHHITGLLYWGGMSYWKDVDDPWTQPETLDRRDQGKELLFNGEGSLLYPGRAIGYDGIASSLRLKALRDSIEDYEYLAILRQRGLEAEAEKIVRPLAKSWFQWEKPPALYEKARTKLAELIIKNSK